MAEQILDIEDVHDLLAIGRDLGARDLQIEPRQLAGHFIEEARPVAAIDFDDRMRGARLVVDEHTGHHGEDLRSAWEGGWAGELAMRLQIPGQHILEDHGEPGELVRAVEWAPRQILDPEGVERHAVRHRHDPGVDDVGAADRQRPGDAREEARVIGGVEGDLGHRSVLIDAFFDGERRAAGFGLAHQPGVPGMGLGIEGQPIERVAAGGEGGEFVFAEIWQQSPRRRLRRSDPQIPPLDGQPAGHHLDRAMVEFAQQRRLPAVPYIGTDGADVGHGQNQQQL